MQVGMGSKKENLNKFEVCLFFFLFDFCSSVFPSSSFLVESKKKFLLKYKLTAKFQFDVLVFIVFDVVEDLEPAEIDKNFFIILM